MNGAYHVPVLAEAAVHYLVTAPEGVYVDGTLGGGGHSYEIARRLGPQGRLIALDRDPEALAACRPLAEAFPGQVTLLHGDFGRLPQILAREGIEAVQGVLLDLGVSSRQLDAATRGFSFLRDGPLDMRMDSTQGVPAERLVNEASEGELARLFREYGEEPRAARAARAIARARRRRPLRTTGELARVLEEALGRRGPKHPATRVFQALRIAVNRELDALDDALAAIPALLAPGGRVVVISYHSLEDRRVKRAFRQWEPRCRCPPLAPQCTCGRPGQCRVLTRKAVKPTRDEVERNPRARSARLRAAEKLVPGSPLDDRGGPG
ncbi:MAG: 16S rRNA (cytosine(1402)-N(4))-methyltransferase RsmH [Deferrisomatales bacterium]